MNGAVENPILEEETRTSEELDTPWQVVVHNDPVNLMTYVTMVFQKVFGFHGRRPRNTCSKCIARAARFSGAACGNGRNFMSNSFMVTCCSRRWSGSADMEFCRQGDSLEISELDPFLAELLRQIPESTNPEGAEAAETALFSAPAEPIEKELCAEWKVYVEPELRRLFRTATETVAADLEQLNGNEKSFANCTLRIPTKHAEAWLSALNQARLVIAAKYGFHRSASFAITIVRRSVHGAI